MDNVSLGQTAVLQQPREIVINLSRRERLCQAEWVPYLVVFTTGEIGLSTGFAYYPTVSHASLTKSILFRFFSTEGRLKPFFSGPSCSSLHWGADMAEQSGRSLQVSFCILYKGQSIFRNKLSWLMRWDTVKTWWSLRWTWCKGNLIRWA